MLRKNLMKNASNILTIYLLIACWHPDSVSGVPSAELPYCNQILDADSSVSCDVDITQQRSSSHFYNGVYCIINDLSRETSVDDDAAACEIDSHHGVQIKLGRITRISHILLQESAFVPRFTNVSLAIGRASYNCKHSRGGAHHTHVMVSNQRFAKFSCDYVNYGVKMIPEANVILINSFVARTMNLAKLRSGGLLGWVLLSDGINAEHFGTFGTDWNETKGTNARPGKSHGNNPAKECPPINPYVGMPESYRNYQLVLDGSINELLMEKPCREGYRFIGNTTDVNQCRNGSWQRFDFPKCEVIQTKTPPNVTHARWSYVYKDVFHEIYYSCDDDYYKIGTGIARYSIENDVWIDVPECHKRPEDPTPKDNHQLTIYSIAAGCTSIVAIALAAAVIYVICCRSTQKKQNCCWRYRKI